MEDTDLEPEAGPSNPRLWFFYHVALKGLQSGAIAGLATYLLRLPSIHKSLTAPEQDKLSAYQSPIGTLQRCMFHGCMHASVIGAGVAFYYLSWMPLDLVEDRAYRIVNTPTQNKVDKWSLIGTAIGLIYGILVQKYDKNHDPFIRKSMLEKTIVTANADDDKEEAENKSSIYKTIFSFSWMNPKIRHISSFGCIGVCFGVAAHFAATRNIVSAKRLWTYTTNCVEM